MIKNLAVEKKQNLSVSVQAIATFFAILGAVLLPKGFHIIGQACGYGSKLGVIFSPMHLPILLAGFLAGPFVGAISGLLSPVASYLISGMPFTSQLPFMMIELFTYGLVSGLLRNVKMNLIFKILIAQVSGRIMYTILSIIFVYILKNTQTDVLYIWKSLVQSLPAIILQLVVVPLVIYLLNTIESSEQKEINDIN